MSGLKTKNYLRPLAVGEASVVVASGASDVVSSKITTDDARVLIVTVQHSAAPVGSTVIIEDSADGEVWAQVASQTMTTSATESVYRHNYVDNGLLRDQIRVKVGAVGANVTVSRCFATFQGS